MANLRFALFGAGFWARFQLHAWREVGGVECVAVCDPVRSKAESFAREMGIPSVYTDPSALLAAEQLDFVDIVASVEAHRPLVELASANGVHVICQKPAAPTIADAEAMAAACGRAGVHLLIHENWRWQPQIRAFKLALESAGLGDVVRARVEFNSHFDDYSNQPFLKELEQLILTDMGTHTLDVARFLFGEAASLYCTIRRVQPDLKGEDMATVVITTLDNVTVVCEMALARIPSFDDYFPQILITAECERGTIELCRNYWVRVTNAAGTTMHRYAPRHYSWADAEYDVVHSSIPACHANLLGGIRGDGSAETTIDDNLRTLRLVYACYDSAARNSVIRF
jgi:predicted dehydrogenase